MLRTASLEFLEDLLAAVGLRLRGPRRLPLDLRRTHRLEPLSLGGGGRLLLLLLLSQRLGVLRLTGLLLLSQGSELLGLLLLLSQRGGLLGLLLLS